MPYKTILVHLNDERRVAGLIDAAERLAVQSDAHVTALYVMPPVASFAATTLGAELIQSGRQVLREKADGVRAAFEAASKGRKVIPEWRLVESTHLTAAADVVEHARTADLVIASQEDPSFEFSSTLDVPDRLVMEAGRPVLLIPRVGSYPTIGKRITVAWNLRKEATRAVFDAMPLLKAADLVRIVWINPKAGGKTGGDLPGAEIATTLARHGVKCEVASTVAKDIAVGDVLLSGLMDDSADLLVMGAWGHSRTHELVFGGVTRHILEHMTVPVLMAH